MVIKDNLPKVLIVGINAWREDGTAHTLMDIFRCWNPDKLALVYSRADMPDTTVCNHYFQISETQVMRSVLRPLDSRGERGAAAAGWHSCRCGSGA